MEVEGVLYEQRLRSARKKTVGSKQTLKAVERGQAKVVFIARDADNHVVEPIRQACRQKNVEIVEVDSLKDLGRACGIDVGCASASIIEE